MAKLIHEFRDSIHTFIRVDDDERRVIDSIPVQRLRHIHQLSLTYLLYPGATHRRFEHSLGVLDLASRVFDTVVEDRNVHPAVREALPEIGNPRQVDYGRRVLRMAALCHDVGHLPFSHAAEAEGILPEGWGHERISFETITSSLMQPLWETPPPLVGQTIGKLAVGAEHVPDGVISTWEAILSEIITGDSFGVDRMDYLLRDSHHTGVAYGRFDHFRLIDTLRILPQPGHRDEDGSLEPQLGVEEGGLRSAEALLLARYFMFTQVYFHRVRRVFDLHLKDFLRVFAHETMHDRTFPVQPESHVNWTDADVTAAMLRAAREVDAPGHDAARRIVFRDPFKLLWEWTPRDIRSNPNAGALILQSAQAEFGEDAVRRDFHSPGSPPIDFPVMLRDGSIESARSLSDVLQRLPSTSFDFIFIHPGIESQARNWLKGNRENILRELPGEEA